MELVVIFGPPAVGKMAVGFELEKITGYKLFHNHMTIELVHTLFNFDDKPFWRLVREFRSRLFEEIKNSTIKGIIFTYVWAFDHESDHEEIKSYCTLMGKDINDVCFVELAASQNVRLERNKTELRLQNKKSKKNTEKSDQNLIEMDKKYQLNTNNGFFYKKYIRIDNDEISAEEAARMIEETFKLRKES